MKRNEFSQWWSDFKLRFSDTAQWVGRDRDEDQQLELLRVWADVLSDVDLADAIEVNAQIQRGQILLGDDGKLRIGFPAYDRENAPAIVRKHAMAMRSSRAFQGPARTETWRDAVNCLSCGDSGFRPVWTNRAIAHMREHHDLTSYGGVRLVLARCDCERGYPRGPERGSGQPGDRRVEIVPRFDDRGFCPVFDWDTKSPDALQRLTQWIADYQDRRLEKAYAGDFESFNRDGGHIARKESA